MEKIYKTIAVLLGLALGCVVILAGLTIGAVAFVQQLITGRWPEWATSPNEENRK